MMLVVWFQAPLQLRLNIFSVLLFLSVHQMPALSTNFISSKRKKNGGGGRVFLQEWPEYFPTSFIFLKGHDTGIE